MRTRTRLIAAAAAVAVLAGGVLLRPAAPRLSDERTGDAAIAQWLSEQAGGTRDRLVAAVVTPDGVRFAGLGADERTEVEIGSVTKTMTALLLAQSAAAGTVALADRAADHAEVGGFEGTLEELASHRSGLPRLSPNPLDLAATLVAQLRGVDPYATFSPEDVLRQAASAGGGGGDEVAYSNLGVAVLGQTLARAEGADYADLVRERILTPLGMTASSVPVSTDALGPDAPTGFSESGRRVGPWTLEGYAPAGGVRSTAEDMARYAGALLTDDPALGVPAATVLDPRFDAGDGDRIGLGWFTSAADDGGATTWHNGGTAGYATMLAMDRERGFAVFVSSTTATSVDGLGLDLLAHVLEEEA